ALSAQATDGTLSLATVSGRPAGPSQRLGTSKRRAPLLKTRREHEVVLQSHDEVVGAEAGAGADVHQSADDDLGALKADAECDLQARNVQTQIQHDLAETAEFVVRRAIAVQARDCRVVCSGVDVRLDATDDQQLAVALLGDGIHAV